MRKLIAVLAFVALAIFVVRRVTVKVEDLRETE